VGCRTVFSAILWSSAYRFSENIGRWAAFERVFSSDCPGPRMHPVEILDLHRMRKRCEPPYQLGNEDPITRHSSICEVRNHVIQPLGKVMGMYYARTLGPYIHESLLTTPNRSDSGPLQKYKHPNCRKVETAHPQMPASGYPLVSPRSA